MALSLQYVLSCTTNYPRSSLSLPAFPKQSHFISRRRHRRHLRVCCQNQKDDGKSKIDRRNMLLGLGSLYGAANLISTPGQASAVPIKTPKLDKCVMGRNWNTGGEPLHAHCCLINDLEVVDYVAPPNAPWRTRKPVQELEPDKVKDFKNAIRKMKSLPPTDPHSFEQQSRIHCAYCNASYFQPDTSLDLQVHFNWLFFPFHRWYIYFFEKICGQLIGKPDFALPYWNWDHPDGMIVDPIFTDDRSPLYDNLRDWENLFGDNLSDPSPQPVSLGGASELTEAELTKAAELMKAKLKKTELKEAELRKAAELMKAEKTKENNKAVMYNEMMTNYSSPTEFMGKPYRKGSWWTKAGGGKSEMGAHNMVHYWVGTKKGPNKPPLFNNSTGEDLGNFYSAGKDPLFYCHHSNVDRMWTIWQTLDTGEKSIEDNDFLNTQFILYDENKRLARVKVGDCINNTALRYEYSEPKTTPPWRDYKPEPQTDKAKAGRAASKAPKVEDVFPLYGLKETVTVVVPKTGKGAVDEDLSIEGITYEKDKFVKFDVFVNDEGSETEVFSNLQRASYAGTFSYLPGDPDQSSQTWPLTDVYKNMDVADEETVLVTLVPRTTENAATIGNISIIKNPTKTNGSPKVEETKTNNAGS